MLKEFKEFALKGNMFDMAVGIVIGAAFATVIGSLVADVFMPIVGQATAGIDLGQLYFVLSEGSPAGPYATLAAAQEAGAVTINYGNFFNEIITFLGVAVAVFFMVKGYNSAKRAEEAAPAAPAPPSAEETLLSEIRDLLAR
ncbi:MAG: large-conductance mechanosensitive channel protein MscL [Gemmatimonadetes bacterium]|nr:large-conductance mechanosensitive channel protein MscL [Gemmatimonadota bacterium]MBT8403115.1 large-conductance mechanosensitive channel protein MscL [Gemmatimonadota bacterium]NNJ47297.1 large-conductance mechanosensitive channel protein MscL [Acidimicrobiia bacterium]